MRERIERSEKEQMALDANRMLKQAARSLNQAAADIHKLAYISQKYPNAVVLSDTYAEDIAMGALNDLRNWSL